LKAFIDKHKGKMNENIKVGKQHQNLEIDKFFFYLKKQMKSFIFGWNEHIMFDIFGSVDNFTLNFENEL